MTPIIAADWLTISINLLLVIHVIICLLLALLVLMQRPKQEGLGAAFGAGLTDQAFGARTTDVLQKGTVYLGTLFFIITLVLAILIGKKQSDNPTIAADGADKAEETTPAPGVPEDLEGEKPAVPAVTMPKADEEDDAETPAPAPVVPPATPPAPEEVPSTPETPETPVTPPATPPAAPTGDQ
ncbi:MAG: preprotein translocase subunit SecG [Akkermansiaceae bacterium]|nr:preprotein translocase subunit SecG [Akkermansiaceae bacterium]